MAAAYAPKVSQTLMTPEPHYLPGYGGHCPRYKFTMGQTYGKLTSRLLTDPEGVCSGQRLLQPRCHPSAHDNHLEEGAGEPSGTKASPLACCTIPGYTGFIPRAQNHFAKTYSKICKEAGHEFARQLARGAGGTQGRSVAASPQNIKPESELLPAAGKPLLAAPPRAPALRMPLCAARPHGAPAAQEDGGGPQRGFVSGFTGFVPRARYLMGASYPTLTRRAWAEFRQMLRKPPQQQQQQSDGRALPPLVKTYPTDRGLLPHYKGYVPGYKFRFGRTYGHLTYDALGQSTPERLMPDRLP